MKKYYKNLYCKCGCGERIEKKEYHTWTGYKIPEYIRGHYIRNNNPMHDQEVVKKFLGENSPNKKLEKRLKTTGESNGFYGKTHTDELKKKWSKERIGVIRSEKSKKKQSETRTGVTFEDRYGKEIAAELKRKSSKRIMGCNNPNWKGGIQCEPYCEQWSDKEYKESIKKRDGYKCLNPECNKTSYKLCIHHIDYIKKNCHPLNLITICISCNSKANQNREWHKCWYQAIIFRR
ncbi:MAG TPA: hypothetical protein VMX17_11535 [Candidatus Glassbacteria bacterium]|nr:hypothetical protein [Candidatus Glassbacteria bacterium]